MKIIHNKKYKVLKLYYEGMPATTICKEYRIPHSTLYKWIADYPKDSIIRVATKKPVNISKLLSHSRKLEAEVEFFHRTVAKKLPLKDRMKIIDDEYGKESLHVQCDALAVDRSTYLNHRYRNKNEDAWFIKREAEYTEIICDIFENSGHVYGAKKIAAIMRQKGKSVSSDYVRRIMMKSGLTSTRSASDKTYRTIARQLRKAAHSSQELKPNGINQVWVSDTTAISVHGRYYYVCAYIDLFSRKVISYMIGRNNSTQLTKRAFLAAYKSRRKPAGLVLHTDNGACYSSYSFNHTLQKYTVDHSYSRPHVPHDNAVAESFFSTLKREGVVLNSYPKSHRELRELVAKYMEHYNKSRPHEHLNYLSPDEFEHKIGEKPDHGQSGRNNRGR